MIERGGMGMVYKARELRTNQPVAVKVMLPQMAANPENIKSFQREIDVTRQLKHPYIVQLYDHGKTDAIFYFVLEYVNGMNLHQFLTTHGGRLSLEQGAAIMLDTLDGLAYAHSAAGIEWDAPDAEPVHHVFFLASSAGTEDVHVQILAAIARAMARPENQLRLAGGGMPPRSIGS